MNFSLAAEKPLSIHAAFGRFSQPTAAKLVADVAGFLVAAAGLKPSFRQAARSLVIDEFLLESQDHFPGQLSLGDVQD
jgi:hypothetical protein